MTKRPTLIRADKIIIGDIAHSYTNPDSIFDYQGYDIRWMGWRVPHDAIIEIGVWVAHSVLLYPQVAYSTTLGSFGWLQNEFYPIDLSITPDVRKRYPNLLALTPADKKALAADAAWRLIELIRAGA